MTVSIRARLRQQIVRDALARPERRHEARLGACTRFEVGNWKLEVGSQKFQAREVQVLSQKVQALSRHEA